MKDIVRQGVVAYLLSAGMALSLLACMGLNSHMALAAVVLAGIILVMSLASIKKLTRWLMAGLLAAGAGVWLLLGGVETVSEILRGITLHFTGLNGALPMVAREMALVLSALLGVAGFALSHRSMGAYPALTVTVLAAAILWLGDQPQALPWLAPAFAGVMVQAAMSNHEGVALHRALPLAAVIAALTLLLTPMEGVTIQPMKEAADKLRNQIFARFMFPAPQCVLPGHRRVLPPGPQPAGRQGGTHRPACAAGENKP